MARIAIASGDSCSLSWACRLQDEGNDVKVWNKTEKLKRVGEGIVPLAGAFEEAYWWLKEGMRVGEPVLFVFDMTGMGEEADKVRRYGMPMLGGGSFCDRLEKERMYGFRIAEEAGIALPSYQQFSSLSEAEASAPDGEFYFKADRLDDDKNATKALKDRAHLAEHYGALRRRHGDSIKHILQEKIEGVALSTARWWNGIRWVGPYEATYENKAFMDGGVGSSTGCSLNAVFFYQDDPQIAEELGFAQLERIFRREQAPPGLYDVNALIGDDGVAYFLEWTPRFGYDSEMTSFRLMPSLTHHLMAVANGQDVPPPEGDIAYSIRLSIPPYPWGTPELSHKGNADGWDVNHIDGMWDGQFIPYQLRKAEHGLVAAGPEGCIGLSLAVGKSLPALNKKAVEYAKELGKRGVDSLQFRTDGDKVILDDAQKVKKAGLEVHQGLLAGWYNE